TALGRGSADLKAFHRGLVERQAEAQLLWHDELPALDGRRLLVEVQGPRHVLDGQAVGDRCDQVHVDLRYQMANDRQIERLGHARDLHPLRDTAYAQEVDHHDVDRAVLEEMAEGDDAVVVLAGGDRRRQRVGDAGHAGIIVVSGRVFEPEEMIGLDAAPDLDRLIHAPELVDVAHEIDVRSDRLAHHAHALDRGGHGGLTPALHLHLAEPHVAKPRAGLGEIVDRMRAHQGSAGVRGDAVAQAAQQRAYGLAHHLALEVPAGDVDGRERQGEDAARPRAAGRAAQLRGDRLDLSRILADGEPGELVHRGLERRGERSAEERQTEAYRALAGAELERDERARVGRGRQAHHERVVGRRAKHAGGHVGDLHGALSFEGVVAYNTLP